MIVDNQIIKLLRTNPAKILNNSALFNGDNHVSFRWPSFLEYLGLGSVLSTLPVFDQNQPLFNACVSTLCATEDTEVLFHMYDRLFAEILNQINALPRIKASFLLAAIKEQRQKKSFLEVKNLLSPTLDAYEASLIERATHTMHDLILYLAWDQMCICVARLFDFQSTHPNFIKGISVLKDCLIESYQHITQQGRTTPGIYRMLESFLFYQMREENFNRHTDADWTMLTQSFQILKSQDELTDFYYIDDVAAPKNKEESSQCYLTLDSPARVKLRLSLAQCMINKLKSEVPGWGYVLSPKKIVYLEL